MAKRIQDFRNFNSEKEKTTTTSKKGGVGILDETKKRDKNRGANKSVPKKKSVKNCSGHFQDENKEKNTKGTGKFLVTFFIILVIIGIGVGCLFSPAFNLTEIIVKNGINVTSEEILNSFNVEIETNIFKIDYKEIKNSIEKLPYIQTATANIKFPNQIEINYVERTPFALIKYLESYLVMDKYGYILEISREKKFEKLPIIYNIQFDSYEIGSKLEDTAKTKYDNVVYLLENAAKNDFNYSISEINYESISNVKLWVVGQEVEIIYGEINRNIIVDKLNYISEILNSINGKQGRLDVSSSDYLEKTVFTERF